MSMGEIALFGGKVVKITKKGDSEQSLYDQITNY